MRLWTFAARGSNMHAPGFGIPKHPCRPFAPRDTRVKSGTRWIVVLGLLAFMGFVVYSTMTRTGVSCEVCLRFGEELVCRKGAGTTEAEAMQAAQESACGGNAQGMSESIACRNQTPERALCTTS